MADRPGCRQLPFPVSYRRSAQINNQKHPGNDMKEVIVLLFSLLAGGFGYLIVTFWMNPVLRYLEIRHEVTSGLIFYANVLHEALLNEELLQRANERRVVNRKHASEIAGLLLSASKVV